MSADSTSTPEQLLKRLDWQIIRRLDGLLQGDYRALFYGNGIDFADLREYQPNDDIRHIDWNVTARMNAPYVRQFIEDRDLTAWFVLDLSRSMTFGPEDRQKQTILNNFVITMARILTRSGIRVGALLCDHQVEKSIPPRTGRKQVLRLIRELYRPNLIGDTTPKEDGMTAMSSILQQALNGIKRRVLLFVVSDFISQPGWESPLTLLNQRHELIAVRIFDPREVELPDAGLLVIQDSETGEQLYVDTSDRGFRQRFKAAADERERALAHTFKRNGVDLLTLSTEDDLVKQILNFAAKRKKRKALR
ncbi:MAG: DUF58 domain-containing protein [Chloroflexota bacterium]